MKQKFITDYFMTEKIKKDKVYGYNSITKSWHCLNCGIDMGYDNSRQLCGKIYCLYT
jgi:hypothetical protein